MASGLAKAVRRPWQLPLAKALDRRVGEFLPVTEPLDGSGEDEWAAVVFQAG